MSVELSDHFGSFIANISLGEPQVSRLNSAWKTIAEYLSGSYGIPLSSTFLQGSYANGTAIEPVEGGEYDLDLVCVCVKDEMTSNAALDELERILKSDGRFRDRVQAKKPCVRLIYAEDDVGRFHVDVVPVRMTGEGSPPLEAPRRDEGWHGTAPAEYVKWCRDQGPLFARTVMAMKRWRDEQQTVRQAIKSMVLQVLVAQSMPQLSDDSSRLAATFNVLHDYLANMDRPPRIPNPVLEEENLAGRWTTESFNSFRTELSEAVQWANTATQATDVVEAADAWREILGDDFPIIPPGDLGIRVSDYSHAQSPAERGWSEQLDPRYSVTISATRQRGERSTKRRPYRDNGPLLVGRNKLRFKARVVAPNHADVWWQVVNTGGHARDVNGLRGGIFRARDIDGNNSADPSENWESTSYTGTHLIRALLVRSDVVVAESDWFRVNIYAKGRPFRL